MRQQSKIYNKIERKNRMLSYISKKMARAYKVSKKALSTSNQAYKETQEYKLIRALQKYQSELLPSQKLSQLATLSYDSQKFYLIFDILMLHISPPPSTPIFDLDSSKDLKQLRNCFVICGFLIRNGASGYIDQFREQIQQLKALWRNLTNIAQDGCSERSQKYKIILSEVTNRIKHFIDLLEDNKRLQRQKQISMLIKQKLKIAEKSRGGEQQGKESDKDKVENFMNNYLWKYISIIDDKIDYVAEVLANRLEKYLLEDVPDNFQIDELEVNEEIRAKSEANFQVKRIKEQQVFAQRKLKKQVYNEDLLS